MRLSDPLFRQLGLTAPHRRGPEGDAFGFGKTHGSIGTPPFPYCGKFFRIAKTKKNTIIALFFL
jgi:hypothetical protein